MGFIMRDKRRLAVVCAPAGGVKALCAPVKALPGVIPDADLYRLTQRSRQRAR